MNPTAMGELQGTSYWYWWITFVFFDAKFIAIFSMLFGAGTVLMWQRSRKAGRKSTWLHYRRMFWLLLLGLAHAHLLWFGDILFSVCGMVMWTKAALVDTARIILCRRRFRHLTSNWFFSAVLGRTSVDRNEDELEADMDPNGREFGDLSWQLAGAIFASQRQCAVRGNVPANHLGILASWWIDVNLLQA